MTGRCEMPDKRRFASRGAAIAASKVLQRNKVFGKSRVYRCTCGGWHLTSHL